MWCKTKALKTHLESIVLSLNGVLQNIELLLNIDLNLSDLNFDFPLDCPNLQSRGVYSTFKSSLPNQSCPSHSRGECTITNGQSR